MEVSMKKLERSRESTVIGGVCGGLSEYFNIDPIIFRIAFVILALGEGIGVIAYIVCWIAIPERPKGEVADTTPPKSDLVKFLPGLALILVGVLFLFDNLFFWFDFDHLWPLIVIGAGLMMIFFTLQNRGERKESERGES
jgi:phage shock protein PspC (stress-responsive transcriptional regulator)